MRNLRVGRKIDVFRCEHDPFSIGRRDRLTHPLQRPGRNELFYFSFDTKSTNLLSMKVASVALAFSIFALSADAEKIALVGATVINSADGKVMPNATVVINGDKIERVAMGKQNA